VADTYDGMFRATITDIETYLKDQYETYDVFQGLKAVGSIKAFPAITIVPTNATLTDQRYCWEMLLDVIVMDKGTNVNTPSIMDTAEPIMDKIQTWCDTYNTGHTANRMGAYTKIIGFNCAYFNQGGYFAAVNIRLKVHLMRVRTR